MGQSDVWLDGSYLGSTNGYFVPHQFEVTELLAAGGDHSPSIEVSCPRPSSASKRVLTGSIQSGPLAPAGQPGGIWRPVTIATTGPVAIQHSRLICTKATEKSAVLSVRLVLDTAVPGDVRVDTSITGPDGESAGGGSETHTLAKGENRLEWTVTVDNPQLWWPAGFGEQPLYEVGVSVRDVDDPAKISDRTDWRTGLRRIRVDRMQWWVNGQRFFAKGVTLGPQSPFLATVDAEACRADLQGAKSAGLNLVRVFGHVAPPELYDAADQLGLLIWQDLPLVGEYSTGARKPAKRLARTLVDLLGHHPSVALWCAHAEPNGPPLPEPASASQPMPPVGRRLGRHLLPSWNRSVLDPQLRRELHAADNSRTALTHSGGLPGVTEIGSADPHLWLGWHVGLAEDLAGVMKKWPRLGTFLSGFGSQSQRIDDWPPAAPTFNNAQAGPFEHYLPRRAYADGESWSVASQAYQADLLRVHIETVRRLKYRPSGGFCLTALADAEPDGGFGILHFDRSPKLAHTVVHDACRPVIVVADLPPQVVAWPPTRPRYSCGERFAKRRHRRPSDGDGVGWRVVPHLDLDRRPRRRRVHVYRRPVTHDSRGDGRPHHRHRTGRLVGRSYQSLPDRHHPGRRGRCGKSAHTYADSTQNWSCGVAGATVSSWTVSGGPPGPSCCVAFGPVTNERCQLHRSTRWPHPQRVPRTLFGQNQSPGRFRSISIRQASARSG
ncbi:MAG: hypothetical protein R2706_15020 [Acidimicrobiales bacterium]